jgi:hypothetical protein
MRFESSSRRPDRIVSRTASTARATSALGSTTRRGRNSCRLVIAVSQEQGRRERRSSPHWNNRNSVSPLSIPASNWSSVPELDRSYHVLACYRRGRQLSRLTLAIENWLTLGERSQLRKQCSGFPSADDDLLPCACVAPNEHTRGMSGEVKNARQKITCARSTSFVAKGTISGVHNGRKIQVQVTCDVHERSLYHRRLHRGKLTCL